MGSVQIDIGILTENVKYSVSPAYHTYKITGINPDYLRYCLECRNQDMFERYVKRGSRQGKTIDLGRWLTYEIPVCEAQEQNEIVSKLDFVDSLITARREQIAKLDELVKSRFVELFGNRGENPYNFPMTTMGNIYKFQYGKGNNIPEDKGEYPCYGSNGIVGHHTEYNSEDSPIIGHIGAYAGIVNWGKGKHYVTYNGVICKLINDQVNPVYGYYLLQLQDYNTVAKSGAAQPFVSYKDLNTRH